MGKPPPPPPPALVMWTLLGVCQGSLFGPRFLSQGCIFGKNSLAKGIFFFRNPWPRVYFLQNLLKKWHLGTKLASVFGKFLLKGEFGGWNSLKSCKNGLMIRKCSLAKGMFSTESRSCTPPSNFFRSTPPGQAHMGQMVKWPWQCTTTGLDNSRELQMEEICQAVTEIWVPQVWQPPAHPPRPWRQYPSSPEGWEVTDPENPRSWVRSNFKSQCSKSNILSTHIPLVPCQLALPYLRYSIFKIWPWKSKVKVIAQGHKVGITPYRLISLSFHVNRPSHSRDAAISKFDVENSRSRSWVRSKLKVTTWVQHSVDSHPFCSMTIRHHIPELRLFLNLTLKIKGQGHGWGHSSKAQCGSNILLTHIPFVPCQSALPFLR